MTADGIERIAAAAAELVVDEGMEYGAAKRKAAQVLGRRSGRRIELPSNEQIEQAVREHIAVFHADTQPAELRALRRLALQWMQRQTTILAGVSLWTGIQLLLVLTWMMTTAVVPVLPIFFCTILHPTVIPKLPN